MRHATLLRLAWSMREGPPTEGEVSREKTPGSRALAVPGSISSPLVAGRIRDKASGLLGSAKLARREEVVEAWRDVLDLRGDVGRGREVFRRERAKCHRLEDHGVELGLPLNTVQNRGPETVLLAVLDPNRGVLPRYLI